MAAGRTSEEAIIGRQETVRVFLLSECKVEGVEGAETLRSQSRGALEGGLAGFGEL